MDTDNKSFQIPEPLPVISPNLPSQPKNVSKSTPNFQDSHVSYASFWIRLLAYIIDLIILRFFSLLIGLYLGVIITFLRLSPEKVSNTIGLIPDLISNYFFYVLYSVSFLSIYSTTPGKNLCRLKVLGENNNKISVMSSLTRSLLQPLSAFFIGIGYVDMLKSDKKQAWHDRIAKTIVIHSSVKTGFIRKLIVYILVFLGLIFFLMVIILIKNNLFR